MTGCRQSAGARAGDRAGGIPEIWLVWHCTKNVEPNYSKKPSPPASKKDRRPATEPAFPPGCLWPFSISPGGCLEVVSRRDRGGESVARTVFVAAGDDRLSDGRCTWFWRCCKFVACPGGAGAGWLVGWRWAGQSLICFYAVEAILFFFFFFFFFVCTPLCLVSVHRGH